MPQVNTAARINPQLSRRAKLQSGLLPGLLGTHLRRAELAVFESFQNALADVGLTPSEFGVLLLIYENEGLSQTELGNGIQSDRSSVVTLIDRFENAGLVIRQPSLLDRRTHALSLTAEGHKLMQVLIPRIQAHEQAITSRISPAEQQQLIELLGRIAP